jgi:CHAD domain-containing protein
LNTPVAFYRLAEPVTPDRIASEFAALGDVESGDGLDIGTTYFDTFDWRLFGDGKSVAVVRDDGRDAIRVHDHVGKQALFTLDGGLPTGFVADLPPGDARAWLAGVVDVRRLLPRLLLTSRRTPLTVHDAEGKIVLRLTVDDLRACCPESGCEAPLGTQLTVVSLRGYLRPFARACALVERRLAPTVAEEPLHEEGMRAVGTMPGDYSSKLRLRLDPDMTALEATRRIHLALLDTMQRNEAGTAAAIDAEYLHDFRVAVRRTRSALGQVDKQVLPADVIARAKEDFRWLQQQTNRMRDLDVYQIDFPTLRAALPENYREHLQPFHDYLVAEGRAEGARVAEVIGSERYRAIRDGWRAYFEGDLDSDCDHAATPVTELAHARIWKMYRRVMKEGAAIDDDSPAEALHELRITCKKLRYLLEFFQSLYPPKRIGRLVKALKSFQNVLGEFQDTEVQSNAILAFGRDMAASGVAPVETQMAMGMIAESILVRQAEARRAFHRNFDAFSRKPVREAFAGLFRSRG